MAALTKILFVGINYKYINPTASLLQTALSRVCRVHFYGPGYVGDEVLSQGVDRYVDSVGGVDLVVATKDVAGDYSAEMLNRFLSRYAVPADGARVSPRVFVDVRSFLVKNRDRVVISLLDVDLFALQTCHFDTFLTHGRYFIGWGSGAIDMSRLEQELESEPYVKAKRGKGMELGLFEAFSIEQRENIITLGHFVSETEFSYAGLSARPNDVFVPGARYHRRAQIRRELRSRRELVVASDRYRIPFQIANRVRLWPHSNFYTAHAYNLAFQRQMARSKACVTDGGIINFTIRKFVEIPAAGALLVCWPTTDFSDLGFRHGVNCLAVSSERQVLDSLAAIAADPPSFQHIASAGRELVLRQHSVSARSAQLAGAIERVLKGTFRGSYWQQGGFVLNRQLEHVGAGAIVG